MAIGTVASIIGAIGEKKAAKKLKKELANAPKYKITDEAFNNQAIAQSNLYGRDRAIQMGQENISQSAADASMQARDITNSTSALLSAVAQINADKNSQLRGLSQDDQMLRQQKTGMLLGANNAMIDEKDKAWNYNENMPFQMRVAAYRDKIKSKQEMQLAGLAYEGQTVSAFASMMGSMGGACDERIKENIEPLEQGIEEVMKMKPVAFDYIQGNRFNDGHRHIGFLAQEMQDIVPDAVLPLRGMDIDGKPTLMIKYSELVPVLVNAIQNLKNQLDELKKEVAEKANEPMEWVTPNK